MNKDDYLYYKQRIALVAEGSYFDIIGEKMIDYYQSIGFECKLFTAVKDVYEYNPTCCIVVCPYFQDKPKDKKIIWVAIQPEQLYSRETGGHKSGSRMINELMLVLNYYDIIVDFTHENADAIKKYTKKRVIVPNGNVYFEDENLYKYEGIEKKYDLLFLGNYADDDRRKDLMDYLSERYNVYPALRGVWEEERTKAICSSKICLNIHRDESRFSETGWFGRLNYYFGAKAFVLSERMADSDPFIEGEDYASFYYSNVCDKIDYYLNNEAERKRIAENAYKKIIENDNSIYYNDIVDAILLEAKKRQDHFSEILLSPFIMKIKVILKKSKPLVKFVKWVRGDKY